MVGEGDDCGSWVDAVVTCIGTKVIPFQRNPLVWINLFKQHICCFYQSRNKRTIDKRIIDFFTSVNTIIIIIVISLH